MARVTTVSKSIEIAADAQTIYRQVSDPTQMGRWSTETTGATVRGGTSGETFVGMEFDGHNRNNRKLRGWWNIAMPTWTTRCVVTAADQPHRFAFEVVGQMMGGKDKPRLAFPIATWEYVLDEVAGGTRVTETWKDDRHASTFGRTSRWGDRLFSGGPTFPQFQARNIETTLARLKADLESDIEAVPEADTEA